jgi:hypothetical protein
MELTAATARAYIDQALTHLLATVDLLGDDLVNARPVVERPTNSAAVLVVHVCGVLEFWLGHVAQGRPSDRDRDAEFRATATVAELHDLVDKARAQAARDLDAVAAGPGHPGHKAREMLPAGETSDASVVLHMIEELYQHLGHLEITADVLLAARPE